MIGFEESVQLANACWVAHFTQRFCFNLPNALARYIELPAHFFQLPDEFLRVFFDVLFVLSWQRMAIQSLRHPREHRPIVGVRGGDREPVSTALLS